MDETKKKRGRKPKVAVYKKIVTVPKKRGRKPKPKPENDVKKVPKKRGRKPKEKVYGVIENNNNENNSFEENIILHLPITENDIKESDNSSLLGQQGLVPIPFEPDINYEEIQQVKKIEVNNNNNDYDNNSNVELGQVDDGLNKKLIKRNILNIMYAFIDGNNREKWPTTTDIYCMWCCHPFETMPCALPEKMLNDKFYVFGNFCSFNCAAAYNFNENPYNVWERYSLLNLMYTKLYETQDIKIKLAPPRNTLKIFGGFMSIEEFRKNFLMNTSYSVVIPPMVSLVPRIEENIYEHINKDTSYIPVDKEAIQDVELKLKRDKPLQDMRNTLEGYMDLKIL